MCRGEPTVVATRGHTDGHCALYIRSRDTVFTGDALVTLDPYTGRTGPRIVGQGGTKDPAAAREALQSIAATGATVLAPGHGELWSGGAVSAVERAPEADVP